MSNAPCSCTEPCATASLLSSDNGKAWMRQYMKGLIPNATAVTRAERETAYASTLLAAKKIALPCRPVESLLGSLASMYLAYANAPSYQTRRNEQERRNGNTLTPEQWQAILVAYRHRCAYCGRYRKRLTKDHVIPVSKGGPTSIRNIVPACWPCNRRKRAGVPLVPQLKLLML